MLYPVTLSGPLYRKCACQRQVYCSANRAQPPCEKKKKCPCRTFFREKPSGRWFTNCIGGHFKGSWEKSILDSTKVDSRRLHETYKMMSRTCKSLDHPCAIRSPRQIVCLGLLRHRIADNPKHFSIILRPNSKQFWRLVVFAVYAPRPIFTSTVLHLLFWSNADNIYLLNNPPNWARRTRNLSIMV